ncbi:Glycosyltransferase Gtf1 [uncultured archaeon]|nr:Glycosyltransferase Gtf1 [uncultured archaeon]
MNKKICFVALGSYSLLTSDENLKYVGGSELKQVIIGRELAKRNFKISFITFDEKSDKENADGITIIKSFSASKNFSNFKKGLMIWKSLKKANAYIYIQGSGSEGIIPLFCFIHRRKYIKWLTWDGIFFQKKYSNYSIITRVSTYIDIKLSHIIVAQNNFQKTNIEKKFKKKCILIKNPIIIPDITNFKNKENKNIILWVGTIKAVKQPDLFLKIAKNFEEFNFKMIGGKNKKDEKLYDRIKQEALTIPNLEFLGFVPHNKIQKYYEEASIFINTSRIEGFSNTFLEAWINCVPVISLNADPDEVICNKKLGLHSKTFEQIILDVNTLLHNDNLRIEMGMNGKKYVEQNHNMKKIADQFEKLIISL